MHARTTAKQIEAQTIAESLRERGYAHVSSSLDLHGFRALASELGHIVAEELIAVRNGAHAYVAKPGRVPLHTDQAQVEIIGWLCQEQDECDGASCLLDSHKVIERLDGSTRDALRRVRLACPPVAGGPPTTAIPVLRATGCRDLFFCSPWLDPVGGDDHDRVALQRLWSLIEQEPVVSIRLATGEALFVDNQRVLHGRAALTRHSRRQLHRVWVITHETASLE